MPKNLMNAVRLSQVWLIRSPVTNHVYLDAERRAYAFFEGYQADKFVAATEGTVADPPAFFDGKALRGQVFSDGGTSLVLSRGYETETVPVGPRNVPLKFYRCDLNAWLNLLKETKQEVWLKRLFCEEFLVPVRIYNGEQPRIVYATVHQGGSDAYMFLAFTTLEEFDAWAEKQPGWSPLSVTTETMWQIGKKHGYLVNPLGNRIVLSGTLLQKGKGWPDMVTKKEEKA